jgi:ethanolamine utilization microcompartment shell protein EutL
MVTSERSRAEQRRAAQSSAEQSTCGAVGCGAGSSRDLASVRKVVSMLAGETPRAVRRRCDCIVVSLRRAVSSFVGGNEGSGQLTWA